MISIVATALNILLLFTFLFIWRAAMKEMDEKALELHKLWLRVVYGIGGLMEKQDELR